LLLTSGESTSSVDTVVRKQVNFATDSPRSSGSFDEGTYDGRQGNIVYSCRDDENTQVEMFDQHFRETYEISDEMLTACQMYATWLEDSTQISATQLNECMQTIHREWFRLATDKLTTSSQMEDCLTTVNNISGDLLKHVVNLTDSNGNSAVHYAVSQNQFDVVSLLLDTGVVQVRANTAGYTPIMLAALSDVGDDDRQRAAIQRLFRSGDVNVRAKQAGQTALMLAVSHGKLEIVRMLLEAGADVNVQDDDGSTALMCASEHGHVDIVKLLLQQDACDCTLVDNDGSNAMSIAMDAGHQDIGVALYAHSNLQHQQPRIKKKIVTTSSSYSSSRRIN
jgi:hypothetical protein